MSSDSNRNRIITPEEARANFWHYRDIADFTDVHRHNSSVGRLLASLGQDFRCIFPTKKNRRRSALENEGEKAHVQLHRLIEHRNVLENSPLITGEAEKMGVSDIMRILTLYHRSGFLADKKKAGLVNQLMATSGFARRIGEVVAKEEDDVHPHALGCMSLLRNVGTFMDPGSYQRKSLLSRVACNRLGIHSEFMDYMRPPKTAVGPLDSNAYEALSEENRRNQTFDHCDNVFEGLTTNQRILEISGFCSHFNGNGDLLTYEQVRGQVHPQPKLTSPWPSNQNALDTVTPDFVEGWGRIYDAIKNYLENNLDVDLEAIRKEVQQFGCV
jgi:hypothetical protein